MAAPQLIALVGAECTGKTTLAQALAAHFGGLWVPEALREFCQQQQRTPRADEQAALMRAQFDQEERITAQAKQAGCAWVFCDTTPLTTAVYSAYYFSDHALLASAHALQSRYALHLVLHPDVPWVPDGQQRDGASARQAVHAMLQQQLQTRHYPCIDIKGQGADRWDAAVSAVLALLY
ncbi:ATP-binding protein [Rhodoferax sp.]|uniref:ATP-binding protein n=1 Tax=Rhodoferax sp. TaxID=50421 RepID=UPI002629203D|nr:ATP-binding protein [Rhodoferax sp.]MDD5001013.1 ATP-binding protein [Thiomonas arsenitoxydans]MDD5480003.1 ATP-binding protein [Rhodoferax sp.]